MYIAFCLDQKLKPGPRGVHSLLPQSLLSPKALREMGGVAGQPDRRLRSHGMASVVSHALFVAGMTVIVHHQEKGASRGIVEVLYGMHPHANDTSHRTYHHDLLNGQEH